MRKSIIGLAAFAIASLAGPVLAQDAAPAPEAPKSPFTVTGGGTLVSDYRFRGISQSNKRFAVQGTANLTHESGAYVGFWGSSIDDYIANGGDAEIDIYGGYKYTFSGTTADVGVLYYYYPGSGGITSDFVEPYASLSHSFGPIGTKLGAAYAPKQHALRCDTYDVRCAGKVREDNLYIYGEGSFAVPNTGFSITGHLGHTFGPSYLSIGKEYTDWNVGASYAWHGLTFGVSYVDTNKDAFAPVNGSATRFRNIAKAGVVGSVGASF